MVGFNMRAGVAGDKGGDMGEDSSGGVKAEDMREHGKLLDREESRNDDDGEASIEGLVYPIYRSGFDEVETSTETTNPKVMQPADFTISHSLVPLLTTLLSHTHATLSSPA